MKRETLWLNEWSSDELRNARLDMGLKQNDIAEVMRVSGNALGYIERNQGGALSTMDLYGILLERSFGYQNFLSPVYIQNRFFRELRLNGDKRIITPEEIYRELTHK